MFLYFIFLPPFTWTWFARNELMQIYANCFAYPPHLAIMTDVFFFSGLIIDFSKWFLESHHHNFAFIYLIKCDKTHFQFYNRQETSHPNPTDQTTSVPQELAELAKLAARRARPPSAGQDLRRWRLATLSRWFLDPPVISDDEIPLLSTICEWLFQWKIPNHAVVPHLLSPSLVRMSFWWSFWQS